MNKEEIMKEIEHIANCELYDTIGVKYLRLNIEKLFEENQQLKEVIEVLKETNKLLLQQKGQLQEDLDMLDNRIDKAIEYISEYRNGWND